MQTLLRFVVVVTLVAFSTGCSPQAKKAKHRENADRQYQNGQFDRAEVEYLNVLKLDPQDGHAAGRLGLIYTAQGRMSRAIAYIMRGHELQPDDLEVRLKIAQLYLATGKIPEAKTEVNFILEKKPQDPEAPSLLIATMANPGEADSIKSQLLNLPPPAPERAPVLSALALLALRLGRPDEAESLLQRAKAADESFASLYSVEAALHIARQNLAEANKSFQKAAELSPPRSPRHVQYAQFKIRTGDTATGIKLLEEITTKVPDYIPAWVALAEVCLAQNKLAECDAAITKALARDSQNLEALILRGRLHNVRNETEKALNLYEKLVATYPRAPVIYQELGRTYATMGDLTKATNSLSQAMALAPNSPEAAILLARVHNRKGDLNAAVVLLRRTVEQSPHLTQAHLILAETYRNQGNFDGALAIYEKLEQQSPSNAQMPMFKGMVLAQQRKGREARDAFERAFSLSPDNPLALEQLVNLELQDKNYQSAFSRVESEMTKNSKLEGFGHLLLAKILLAQDDKTQAETHLKRVIELMPDSPTGYFLLAGIYARSNQEEKALAQLTEVLNRDPKQITALMLSSVIHGQRGNHDLAKAGYEKLIAINPRSMVALNNLAYLYSERFNDLDKAHELAQRARQLAPSEPHNADTLGWILHKKRQYPWALSLLLDAAEKLPEQAEVHYHLGLTHYMMGAEEPARTALERAIQLNPAANWVVRAQNALAVLSLNSTANNQVALALIDKALAERPEDPIALARLAALQEQEGKIELAIASLTSALKNNSHNINLLLNLARLHEAANNPSKAVEYAKEARKQAPDDGNVAQILGRLAYQSGDHSWASSLLQEATRKQPNSPDLLFDYAQALFSTGRVGDAQSTLRSALQIAKDQPGSPFTHGEEAKIMLELIPLADVPGEAVKRVKDIEAELARRPNSAPALMAAAAVSEHQLQPELARQKYEKLLSHFPEFFPAKRRLVLLSSHQKVFDQRTYDYALQTRKAYPNDSQIAKVLGVQNFLKGDFARTIPLLKEAIVAHQTDAESYYYLGQAQLQVKNSSEGRSALEQSMRLGLPADLAASAERALKSLN